MVGIVEHTGKVASTAVEAMKGSPLAIGLLMVNIGFLGFTAYILGEVAENAKVRNQTQLALINDLVHDIRDCRQGPKPQADIKLPLPSLPPLSIMMRR